jgi:hypothetical protein
MSDYSPRVVRRPGSEHVFGIIDLTERQVSLIMGALATLSTDNEEVADGYPLYSDLFASVEQLDADIELNPYVIGTLSGPDPTAALRALIDEMKERAS